MASEGLRYLSLTLKHLTITMIKITIPIDIMPVLMSMPIIGEILVFVVPPGCTVPPVFTIMNWSCTAQP
jgi:hypothetical protein